MNGDGAASPTTTRIDWEIDLVADLITEDPNLTQALRIEYFNPESFDIDYDPWVAADQADAIANKVGIRIGRDKELTLIAMLGDQCVGAVWSTWYPDRERQTTDDEDDVWIYDFDVVSDPTYRAAGPIGLKLIEAALDEYRHAEHPRKMIRVYVVNPKLITYLERHYGFENEGTYSHGAAHMTYYGG